MLTAGSQFPVTHISHAGVARVALPNNMEVEFQVPLSWPAVGGITLLDLQAPVACPALPALVQALQGRALGASGDLNEFLGQVCGALEEAGLA